ncbi:MAG: cellobiose phosphorylase, partial [Candidatus Omnitrophica bacterium]|nr:cellobiose phosphorylase [Candidatus Omnitrophota bacterium]
MPLTNPQGSILSSIGPNLSGDIKRDNDHFLTVPASAEDLRSSPLCRREFFIKAGGKVYRLSEGKVIAQETGILYQKLDKQLGSLEVNILNFVPSGAAAEVMQISVSNNGKKPVEITATSFIPLFGRSEKNLRDHRHVSSLLNRIELNKYGIFLKPTMVFDEKGHSINNTIYYCQGYQDNSLAPEGQFPTLDMFYGQGDIFHPDAIEKDIEPAANYRPEFDGKEACAGLKFRKKILRPGETSKYVLILGIEEKKADINKTFERLRTPALIQKAFSSAFEGWQDYLSGLSFDFGDPQYNGWLVWVKLQPTLRRLFGCSFLPHFDYGKGGRGWRDLWQDALALLQTEPDAAKKIIEKSFNGVRLDGSNATIITADGFLADRNKISRVWMDHGVWPYMTLRQYINRSADLDVLLRKAGYFRDHQLWRAAKSDPDFRQDDFMQRDRSGRKISGTILEHVLVQNCVQFFNVGSHNIIRLENADWNDGLDMAADKGESVAFSFMYAHNLADLCFFLRELKKKHNSVSVLTELLNLLDSIKDPIDYDSPSAKQKRLARYFKAIEHPSGKYVSIPIDRLIIDLESKAEHMSKWLSGHEWLREGFFNGYYDNKGIRVDGKRDTGMTMMLASAVFSIMSGLASSKQITAIWRSINLHLKDKKLGGFRLNTDLRKPAMDLGRAYGFAYGDKENGAFFSHMNVMLANALYSRAFVGEGKEVMDSIYAMATSDKSQIPAGLPEYFNNSGRGLYLYLTGSASWYIHTLLEQVLGITYKMGNLVLKPGLMRSNFAGGAIAVQTTSSGKKLSMVFHSPKTGTGPFRLEYAVVNRKGFEPA